MDQFAELLRRFVQEYPPACGDAQAVVDQLYWAYMEHHRADSTKMDKCYEDLRKRVNLPLHEYDEVLYIVSDLCIEYGKQAFMEGLKVGMVLIQTFVS